MHKRMGVAVVPIKLHMKTDGGLELATGLISWTMSLSINSENANKSFIIVTCA